MQSVCVHMCASNQAEVKQLGIVVAQMLALIIVKIIHWAIKGLCNRCCMTYPEENAPLHLFLADLRTLIIAAFVPFCYLWN